MEAQTKFSFAVRAATTFFIYAYLADACFTLFDVTLIRGWGDHTFTPARSFYANALVVLANLWLLFAMVTPRARSWTAMLLAISALWFSLEAQPLNWVANSLGHRAVETQLVTAQLLFGFAALIRMRLLGHWYFPAAYFRPAHTWMHAGGALGARWLGLLLLYLLYVPILAADYLPRFSGGYLLLRSEGLYVGDRPFVNEKHQKVRLVGMAHFGNYERYRALFETMDVPGTVILEEGVTDTKHVLFPKDRDRSRPEYTLGPGVIPQPRTADLSEVRAVTVRHADVDVSDLSEEARELARQITLWRPDSDSGDPLPFLRLMASLSSMQTSAAVLSELIEDRNAAVLAHIDATVQTFRTVVVPWDAMHMPGLERGLLARGFEPNGEITHHELLPWSSLLPFRSGSGDSAPPPPPPLPGNPLGRHAEGPHEPCSRHDASVRC